MSKHLCRLCEAPLTLTFADLGMSPLSNSYVTESRRHEAEVFYPLHAYVCGSCHLVQLDEFESRENIFKDYFYFSSYSDLWLRHCEGYANYAIDRFGLNGSSQVVEVASNDGYLLQYFKACGVPVLGVEPAANVAQVAVAKGIPSEVAFFGVETATRLRGNGYSADLMVAINVLAHVPDIKDFVAGFKVLLKPTGLVTFEFPSLHRQIEGNEFDTIYHEHFSYLSLLVVEKVVELNGMRVFDVQELPTHGGSLRVYACHRDGPHRETPGLETQRRREREFGLKDLETYRMFSIEVVNIKARILEFFLTTRREGKSI